MRALEEARRVLRSLQDYLQATGLPLKHASVTDFTPVLKALATAFCTRSAIHHTADEYRTVHERAPGVLPPVSSLLDQNFEWVIYECQLRGLKQHLCTATAVNAEWLAVGYYHQAVHRYSWYVAD